MKIGKKRIYSGVPIDNASGVILTSGDEVVIAGIAINSWVNVRLNGFSHVFSVHKDSLEKIQKSLDDRLKAAAGDKDAINRLSSGVITTNQSHTPPPRELYCGCKLNPIEESTVHAQDRPAGSINFGSAIAPTEKAKDQADKIIDFLDAEKNLGDTVVVMADAGVNLNFSDSIEDTAKKYGIPFSGMYCSGADGKPKQEPNTEKYAFQIKQLRSAADMIESGLYSPEKIIIELKNSEE